MQLVRGVIEKGRTIRSVHEIKNRQPLGTLTLVPHSAEAKEVAEAMRDLILEELNVEELLFASDDSELAKISAKPNFAGIKAKGVEYAKNMKSISAAITALSAEQIKEIQSGKALNVSELEIDASCLMIVREVAEGLAVEADENYTAALDLKITPELRQSCIARELVNRIQNRRKEMDLQITDKINIFLRNVETHCHASLHTQNASLRHAIDIHKAYILEETQGVELSTSGIGSEGGEWVSAVVEGCEVEILVER
jgi:isoleucyl-tRNA synthetase